MTRRCAIFPRLAVSALVLGGVAIFAGCTDQAASNAFGPGGSSLLNGGGNLSSFITGPGGLSDALLGLTGTTPTTGVGSTGTLGGTTGLTGTSGISGTSGMGGTLGGSSTMGGLSTIGGAGTLVPNPTTTGGLGLSSANNAFGTATLTNTVPSSSFGSLSGLPSGTSTLTGTSLGMTTTVNSVNAITQGGF